MRKVIIIGEIPEHFQSKIEELKADGIEIVCLKDTDELEETTKSIKIGIVGHGMMGFGNSHFLHEEMSKEKRVEIVRVSDDSDVPFAQGSFESIYGGIPKEIVMQIRATEPFDLPTIYPSFENRNRYKKREYKMSAGTRYKPNKKRK
jgi:hypothetical protein